MASSTPLSSSLPKPRAPLFPPSLLKKVPEASYMTAENADRYRPIMRFFLDQHNAHQYWLSADDVVTYMQQHFQSAYTEEMADQDLAYLVEKGNLMAEQETGRVRTLPEFLKKRYRYQLTPYGIAFERVLIELEQGILRGSLDATRLETLWSRLEALHALLAGAPDPDQRLVQQVHGYWQEAYEAFNKIRTDASDYFGAMNRARPQDFQDIEAFLAYKDLLAEYLSSFLNDLMTYKEKVRARLEDWNRSGTGNLLVAYVVHYHAMYVPMLDGSLPDREQLLERFRGQFSEVADWFEVSTDGRRRSKQQRTSNLEMLRRVTINAIEQVVRQTQRMVDRRRMGMSRRQDLERLAEAFAACRSLDDARRLAGVALGVAMPRHILGTADQIVIQQPGSVWAQPPHIFPLSPVQRGRQTRGSNSPIRNRKAEREQVLADEIEQREREIAFWDSLFQGGEINVGRVSLDDVSLRQRLVEVVGQCLSAADRTAIASDGSTIVLTEPEPKEPYGKLSAPDGVLYLPQYRLRRTRRE